MLHPYQFYFLLVVVGAVTFFVSFGMNRGEGQATYVRLGLNDPVSRVVPFTTIYVGDRHEHVIICPPREEPLDYPALALAILPLYLKYREADIARANARRECRLADFEREHRERGRLWIEMMTFCNSHRMRVDERMTLWPFVYDAAGDALGISAEEASLAAA
jgi:hypothetical protein